MAGSGMNGVRPPDISRVRRPGLDVPAVLAVLRNATDAADARELLEMLGLTAPSGARSQDQYDPAALTLAGLRARRSARLSGLVSDRPVSDD